MKVQPGSVMFLVGPSSAGKSSLGRALLEVLPDPHLFFETDRFGLSGPKKRPEFSTMEYEDAITRGSAFAIRGYLDAGLNLIVERDFWYPRARTMAAGVFKPYDAWLIGLEWDIAVLERRERERTDGIILGTAFAQAKRAGHWNLPYDFVVDAVAKCPEAAAQEVVDWLAARPAPRGIREIEVGAGR